MYGLNGAGVCADVSAGVSASVTAVVSACADTGAGGHACGGSEVDTFGGATASHRASLVGLS